MVCPFAKRAGPLVFCEAVKRKVNPLAFPCFSERYATCRHYPQQPMEKPIIEERVEEEEKPGPEEVRREEAIAEERPVTRRGLGIRIDGKPAENCLECLYYGAHAKVCLKLGVDIKDPYKPPCFEVES